MPISPIEIDELFWMNDEEAKEYMEDWIERHLKGGSSGERKAILSWGKNIGRRFYEMGKRIGRRLKD